MNAGSMTIQGIGLISTVLYFASFQFRNNKTLFRVQLLSYLLYTVHFMLLGAFTGGVSYILNAMRSFCLGSNKKVLHSWYMCAVLCFLQLAVLYFTWNGPLSVLPVAANIAAAISGYTDNGKAIRFTGILINSPLWLAYNVCVGSFAGVADEIISEISMIVSLVRFRSSREHDNKECEVKNVIG